jgi:hypothetical protein
MRPIRTLGPSPWAWSSWSWRATSVPEPPPRPGRSRPTSSRPLPPRPDPPRHAAHQPCPQAHADPGSNTIGLWPIKTLTQARKLQDRVDASHQPWLPSAESVSTAYAPGELHLFWPYVQHVGPAAHQVRSRHREWEATLYLAQPVRHDNGVWAVTRSGGPVG